MEPIKMIQLFKAFSILFLLTAMSCSEKPQSTRNKSDNEFIQALIYHHEFEVSAIIDDLLKTNNIDKKIKTDRVAQSPNFWTPLCYSSFIGNRKATKLLIESGANINYKDGNGLTPLMLACLVGNIEEIEILLQAGADINEVNVNNNTGLILAAAEGNLLTVKYLIDKGCEIRPKTGGQNALDFATFYQHKDVIEYLKGVGLTKTNEK